jgi:hypothetical protein
MVDLKTSVNKRREVENVQHDDPACVGKTVAP